MGKLGAETELRGVVIGIFLGTFIDFRLEVRENKGGVGGVLSYPLFKNDNDWEICRFNS